jgi:dATP pyrophosphohydrolase
MKLPRSVLVVVHTAAREVLLLQRAAGTQFWQSVTGSLDAEDEPFDLRPWNVAYTFEIYSRWRHRFAPGVTHNTERLFSLRLPGRVPVRIAREEHTAFAWVPWREAARRCFSWSNRDAILLVGEA